MDILTRARQISKSLDSHTEQGKTFLRAISSLEQLSADPKAWYLLGKIAFSLDEVAFGVECFQQFFEAGSSCAPSLRAFWSMHLALVGKQLNQIASKNQNKTWSDESLFMNLLRYGYGLERAAREGAPVTPWGTPLPLYSYPAIEYLAQFDFSAKNVFEFGAGNSTLFWSQRARKVTSVETNKEWYDSLHSKLDKNGHLFLVDLAEAHRAIEKITGKFDVIIVDGSFNRFESARTARPKLKRNGMFIVDNTEWYPNTSEFLRKSGLIQIDFVGLRPSQSHCSTTSVFLTRDFNFKPLDGRQPGFGIGTVQLAPLSWDQRLDSLAKQAPKKPKSPGPRRSAPVKR